MARARVGAWPGRTSCSRCSTTSRGRPRRSTTPSARPSSPTGAGRSTAQVTLASRLMASRRSATWPSTSSASAGSPDGWSGWRTGGAWSAATGQDWIVAAARGHRRARGASTARCPRWPGRRSPGWACGSALRRLADAGAAVRASTCVDGARHDGVVRRVGADFVEVARRRRPGRAGRRSPGSSPCRAARLTRRPRASGRLDVVRRDLAVAERPLPGGAAPARPSSSPSPRRCACARWCGGRGRAARGRRTPGRARRAARRGRRWRARGPCGAAGRPGLASSGSLSGPKHEHRDEARSPPSRGSADVRTWVRTCWSA